MKLDNARAIARLLGLLNKFKLLSDRACDNLVNQLTVRVLQAELVKRNPKDILVEDLNGTAKK